MKRQIMILLMVFLLATPVVYANGEGEDLGTSIDIEANVDGYLDADVEFNAENGDVSITYNGENLLETINAQENGMNMMLMSIKNERENEKLIEDILAIIEEKEVYSVQSDNELYARDNMLAQYIGVTETETEIQIKIVNGDTTLINEIEALWRELKDTKEVVYDLNSLKEEITVLSEENQELRRRLDQIDNENMVNTALREAEMRQIETILTRQQERYDYTVKDIVSAISILLASIPIFKYKILA